MKLKRSLLFSLLGLGGFAFVTTTGMVLSSCSSTSNPYAKFTNVNATIGGTKYTFKHNTNSTFGIVENDKFTNVQELSNKIYQVKDKKGNAIKLKPGMEGYTPEELQPYKDAILKYNNTYIASQIYTYIASFVSYFTQILVKSQSYINPINANKFVDITQWNTKQTSTSAKEFMFATKFGAGEGYQIYGIWPKTIDLDFQISNAFKNPGDAAYTETQDPNPESLTVNINKFDVTYSWFKHEQVGGEYINNIDVVNNSLTSTQKSWLKNQFGIDKFSTLDYKISFNTTASPINFTYNPAVVDYKDPSDSKKNGRIYSGLGLIAPGFIQDDKKKWISDFANQSPYKILSLSPFQTLKIVKEASTFFKGGLVNNKNYLPYRAYELIWKIGYFANNANAKEIDATKLEQEVSSKQSWFLNENNMNLDPQNTEWTTLKNNPNYAKGIEEIYKLFNIMN